MRQNALEISQKEFNWEHESERLIRVYQDILTGHEKAGSNEVKSSLSTPP
jgi:hypothetical protein